MFNKKRKIRKISTTNSYKPLRRRSSLNLSPISRERAKKKKNPRVTKAKRSLAYLFITLTLIGSTYFFLFSGYFKVTTISVSDQNLQNQVLADKIKTSIDSSLGKNIFFLNTEDLKIQILTEFPEIQEVEVEKNHPQKLTVKFLEYPLVANIISETSTVKKSYVINSIGYIIKEDLENPALPYIRIKSDEPLNPSSPAIENTKLKYILDAIIYFQDKFGMRVVEAIYKKTPREIHLLTEKNFVIWLDMQQTAESQLKKLKKALVKLDIFTEPLEYIDLRIAGENGDKIIYKRR